MALKAYILIKIEPGKDRIICNKLNEIEEVKAIARTYGLYDALITVEVESHGELDEFIFNKLRTIPGVKETMTLISANL